ncbi:MULTISPECIES: hypothetical protein [unclassified Pseudomonas]|uniref:hypothetical protein n=1 Tax=unclassified Pseudomonas TaxID=196821 RepID=UPI002AC9849E|nr:MULTISPECIES: hypothetical protein [unclassified Pseudomonas]MEB0044094.1 hypothetical protein [Pseudomonas sp. Dout3]MEB0094968.1 hypothetical protein [Pseudomonas sp. DC1.2]WPX58537.1 hypothetical protein RHM68_23620 [Pseudomonas sp. DC1.2]
MTGSYLWTAASIWHPTGCQCRFDLNYVACGCFGSGGWAAGPLNPTEYTQELAEAAKNAQEEADAIAQNLRAQAELDEQANDYEMDREFLENLDPPNL